nr:hypothetical protein CFP56_00409 [Quercus suber]
MNIASGVAKAAVEKHPETLQTVVATAEDGMQSEETSEQILRTSFDPEHASNTMVSQASPAPGSPFALLGEH